MTDNNYIELQKIIRKMPTEPFYESAFPFVKSWEFSAVLGLGPDYLAEDLTDEEIETARREMQRIIADSGADVGVYKISTDDDLYFTAKIIIELDGKNWRVIFFFNFKIIQHIKSR